MAMTAEQRAARRGFIGSSDAPAIAGVDPNRSRMAVFMEKVFDVEELPNKGPIARGNRWERTLLDWAEEELGVEVERNLLVRHPSDPICGANLDGRVRGKRIGIEAKFTSLGADFGEPGTDMVPDKVLVQTHHAMYVADLDVFYVPVLLARFDRPEEAMFKVERNEGLIEQVVEMDHAFWRDHIETRIPPPLDGPPALDVIKRIRRVEGAIASLDPALVEAWEAAKLKRNLAKDEADEAESAMLAALGEAEIGDYGDASKWLTYFKQNRKGYEVQPTSFRVPRVSKRIA